MTWKNKKVLVTGSDGFIGSHLVERLIKKGAKVRAFVYYNSFNSWGWLDSFSKRQLDKIDIFPGDIRDPNAVSTSMKDIDVVFHLAALIGIPFSYHAPDSYVDTNVKGTLNVLQSAKRFRVSVRRSKRTVSALGKCFSVIASYSVPANQLTACS